MSHVIVSVTDTNGRMHTSDKITNRDLDGTLDLASGAVEEGNRLTIPLPALDGETARFLVLPASSIHSVEVSEWEDDPA